MKRHYMLKILLLLLVVMPLAVYAQDAQVETMQEIFTQEIPTPDIVVDEESNKAQILNDSHSIKLDNSEKEHCVSDDIIYNDTIIYNDDYANNPNDN